MPDAVKRSNEAASTAAGGPAGNGHKGECESCPNCGETALPASGYPGGFVPEDAEYSMAAHCLTCRWQGPEPMPLVKGGQGRDGSELIRDANVIVFVAGACAGAGLVFMLWGLVAWAQRS